MNSFWSRQDGHDPENDENCATGLCEHERGSALLRRPAADRPGVLGALLGSARKDRS